MNLESSKQPLHSDELPPYTTSNMESHTTHNTEKENNTYYSDGAKIIKADDARKLIATFYERTYGDALKCNLKSIFEYITTNSDRGTPELRFIPKLFAHNNFKTSTVKLKFKDTNEESIYYEKLCNDICDILTKNGYNVTLSKSDEQYGIPKYKYYNRFIIKW